MTAPEQEKAIVWIHGDCLDPGQEALRDYPHAPAIWVWDEALLARRQLSLKRILFIYECLLDLPVTIRRGQVAAELHNFAREQQASTVITMRSISPGFRRICRVLRQQGLTVVEFDQEPFVTLPAETDLRRFSRYWRVVQRELQRG
jgi:hypothetical protein